MSPCKLKASFLKTIYFLSFRKDIPRRIEAFGLNFSGLVGLTELIVMSEAIRYRIPRIEVIKIIVSQSGLPKFKLL